jgi:hypothetical protein
VRVLPWSCAPRQGEGASKRAAGGAGPCSANGFALHGLTSDGTHFVSPFEATFPGGGGTITGTQAGGFDILGAQGRAALRNGNLYVAGGAYDDVATADNCSQVPPWPDTVCRPKWTYDDVRSDVAVTATTVYAATTAGVGAFPALGCAASTCPATWTGTVSGSVVGMPAVGDGVVIVGTSDGSIDAFAADGCGTATCAPLWSANVPAPLASQASIAGGVVFIASTDGTVSAFALHGCGQGTCAALWQRSLGSPVSTAPAVAGDAVYVTSADGIHAFRLTTP